MTEWVFISSSSDLAELRQSVADKLTAWLRSNGFEHRIALYLWEDDTENGRSLSERIAIQEQLLDPASSDVPLTVCLFGERCGEPLLGAIPSYWQDRLTRWRAPAGGPGLLHPWPDTPEARAEALERGAFPLTGTVFELLSAHYQLRDANNVVAAYAASRRVDDGTRLEEIDFNALRHRQRLTAGMKSEVEREPVLRNEYRPQKHALLNLLKSLRRHAVPARCHDSLEKLEADVVARAIKKLEQRFGIASLHNPFKLTLEHWSIDDRQDLPGREALIQNICADVEAQPGTLLLLKGRSGCGKSSLLQRGVLARLRERAAVTVSVRPSDLAEISKNRDRLDILWQIIADQVDCHDRTISHPRVRRNRDKRMAEHLTAQLDKRGIDLVIGLDQFEEILDELNLFRDDPARATGWWLVIKFFSRMAASNRVKLVATLESSREQTFLGLDIERELGRRRNIIDVDVNADQVAEIAKHGFARAGLPLHPDVLEAIKHRWGEFERQTGGDVDTSSPLPLVCLWLAALYERFEDKAQLAPKGGFDAVASRDTDGTGAALTMADIGSDGIAFENVIQRLADEAWEAAGESRDFSEPIEADPEYSTLVNFLGPFIGLDTDGHKRLLPVVDAGGDATTARLRQEFKSRRLLVAVPAGGAGKGRHARRVRLVHQAVIDRWSPSRRWFVTRIQYLHLERELRNDARYWWSKDRRDIPGDDPSIIDKAAQVLLAHRVDWRLSTTSELAADDEILKRQVTAIFLRSETPEAIVPGSARHFTHAHLAAYYHLVELLERFVKKAPDCLQLVCKRGDNLLHQAAWSEGEAIDFLIGHGVALTTASAEWNAIEAPIQRGLHASYDRLIARIEDVDAATGPDGWRMVHSAARYGNFHVLNDLKARGANLRVENDHRQTALHVAASNGQVAAFIELLGHISPMQQDAWQDTPLGCAAQAGQHGVICAFLDSGQDDATLDALLTHKSVSGCTPLMFAAKYKHPQALQLLLDECDPRDAEHRAADGKTVLHLAVDSNIPRGSSEEVRARARQVVQMLLDDGRVDPTTMDDGGCTAFDVAQAYEAARRVIRRDKRMPWQYDKMTPKMRIDDLTSRQPGVVLDLLRTAPQALTDRHEGEKTGLQLLIRDRKTDVLTVALKESLISDELMHAELAELAKLACDAAAVQMRTALIDRLSADASEAKVLPLLLNAAIAAMDKPAVAALRGKGASYLHSDDEPGITVFHSLAIAGRVDDFVQAAALASLPLPLDDWGRRPSELAALKDRRRFQEIEDQAFVAPHPDQVRPVLPMKLHNYARKGDVRSFERQARGAPPVLPRDAQGRWPSQVAPENTKAQIAALEARYFKESIE